MAKKVELKWRRFVGYGQDHEPIRLNGGSGVLLTESRNNEVQRRDSEDGKVRWRLRLGEPFRTPVSVREELYIATDSGRLMSLDAETGDTRWVQQFPQGLVVGPGIDETKRAGLHPG